ncbi:hypothetical protein TSUD_356490 [Trifolium subterraneum]|uniref:ABC transmembrane type-1 domain-containing protein n=1 Tax=Trifolium subterraneum TaxID=3900 RepID=A0A2Z6MBG1_TRISU|nr:hypothetical protein TSUD_356490 [Trifolium subterraneum]
MFVYLRSYLNAHLGLKASTAYFSSFTTAIFNSPMMFFDSTPVGRILTRASSDLSILDFDMPHSIHFALSVAIEVLVIICIMVSVTWQVLIVAVPAMVASIFIQALQSVTVVTAALFLIILPHGYVSPGFGEMSPEGNDQQATKSLGLFRLVFGNNLVECSFALSNNQH